MIRLSTISTPRFGTSDALYHAVGSPQAGYGSRVGKQILHLLKTDNNSVQQTQSSLSTAPKPSRMNPLPAKAQKPYLNYLA